MSVCRARARGAQAVRGGLNSRALCARSSLRETKVLCENFASPLRETDHTDCASDSCRLSGSASRIAHGRACAGSGWCARSACATPKSRRTRRGSEERAETLGDWDSDGRGGAEGCPRARSAARGATHWRRGLVCGARPSVRARSATRCVRSRTQRDARARRLRRTMPVPDARAPPPPHYQRCSCELRKQTGICSARRAMPVRHARASFGARARRVRLRPSPLDAAPPIDGPRRPRAR